MNQYQIALRKKTIRMIVKHPRNVRYTPSDLEQMTCKELGETYDLLEARRLKKAV